MAAKASYLIHSKTGWFSYRRKVPERLRPHFPTTETGQPMQEWKVSFHTKDPHTAQRLWVLENRNFDAAARIAQSALNSQTTETASYQALRLAKRIAVDAGFSPELAPQPPINDNDEDWVKFRADRQVWREFLEESRQQIREVSKRPA